MGGGSHFHHFFLFLAWPFGNGTSALPIQIGINHHSTVQGIVFSTFLVLTAVLKILEAYETIFHHLL